MPKKQPKFFLWISGPALTWYIGKVTNKDTFKVFAFNEGDWLDKGYYYLYSKQQFLIDHFEISEDEAVRCILGGPEYCYKKQVEILRALKK